MFCKYCGKEVRDEAVICTSCGCKIVDEKKPTADEESAIGWAFLSWFIPIVGLILFLIWRQDRPKTSKICGICALVAVSLEVVLSILIIVFYWSMIFGVLGIAFL